MTHYSKGMTGEQLSELYFAVVEFSYRSKRDRCLVVLMPCLNCGRQFEELLVAAKARIRAGRVDFLCLACDGDAEASGLVGIVSEEGVVEN